MENLNLAFDSGTLTDMLGEIDVFYSDLYYEKLKDNPYFDHYSDLFVELSHAAEALYTEYGNVMSRFDLPYKPIKDSKAYDNRDWFNIAAMTLNYDEFDYLNLLDSYMSCDVDDKKTANMDLLSKLTKVQQRDLIIRVFELFIKAQQLRANFKTLLELVKELQYRSSAVVLIMDPNGEEDSDGD